jgi:cyclopropane fatty-acyl-phospholipid synthase-like methyltransferase
MERAGSGRWKAIPMAGKYLVARMTADPAKRVRRFYDIYSPRYLPVDRSSYMNFGYWDEGCATLDEANEALAALLADSAGFQPDDRILDVGFGYGDQDFYWLRDRGPRKIDGLNITPGQVHAARMRAAEEGLGDRLDFRVGSATDMPFAADSFDRVVALESAFHFYPRSDFLSEAYRVLRPGGVLAAVDLVPLDGSTSRSGIGSRPLAWITTSVDEKNWYSRDVYADELAAASFTQIRVQSIRDKVFEPWRQHIVAKLSDPVYQQRIGKTYHRIMTSRWSDQPLLQRELALLDYVAVTASKPEVTA